MDLILAFVLGALIGVVGLAVVAEIAVRRALRQEGHVLLNGRAER